MAGHTDEDEFLHGASGAQVAVQTTSQTTSPTIPTSPPLSSSTSSSSSSTTTTTRPALTSRPSLSRSASSSLFSFGSGNRGFGTGHNGAFGWDENGMEREGWLSGFTLLDVFETFFDSRLDLLERQLRAQSYRLKSVAGKLVPEGLRTPRMGGMLLSDADIESIQDDSTSNQNQSTATSSSHSSHPESAQEGLTESQSLRRRHSSKIGSGSGSGSGKKYGRGEMEMEVERIKMKLSSKITDFSATWRSAQIVRTREKVSFLFGVLSLTITCLMIGATPQYLPLAYTLQSCFYFPTRIWDYKRKSYHYFLFDLCYFVNILDLVWIWFFPSNAYLFISCYCLTLGPIASAIITWRNSLVFHSLDKVCSTFIHMYPTLVMTAIRHYIPNASESYPALLEVQRFRWWTMILLSAIPYTIWQGLYWKFVIVDRRTKIESGQRQTSFRYMLNDKRGPIGRMLQGIPPKYREASFIGGQLVYSIIFMLPAATFLIKSSYASSAFLMICFSVSVWNGASYYVEVFGRKFERELQKLRKEMETMSTVTASTTPHIGSPLLSSVPDIPTTAFALTPAADGQDDSSTTASDRNSSMALSTSASPSTARPSPNRRRSQFRPCIDLHDGVVKQIVGGTLSDEVDEKQALKVNFVASQSPSFYADLYRTNGLLGGHVIKLGPNNDNAAREALSAWPGKLQVGGGINIDNAQEWLDAGAEKVIVTSTLFPKQKFSLDTLKAISNRVGKDKLVVDISCRTQGDRWIVAMNKWRDLTDTEVNAESIKLISEYCSEILVHAADVEGLCNGIDEKLVRKLGEWADIPCVYAGGARDISDLDLVDQLSDGKVDLTYGSSLDIFGGKTVKFDELVTLSKRLERGE